MHTNIFLILLSAFGMLHWATLHTMQLGQDSRRDNRLIIKLEPTDDLFKACVLHKYADTRQLLESCLYNREYIEQEVQLVGWDITTVLMARLLVQHGVSTSKIDREGTVLHWACHAQCSPTLLAYYLKREKRYINKCAGMKNNHVLCTWAWYSLGQWCDDMDEQIQDAQKSWYCYEIMERL